MLLSEQEFQKRKTRVVSEGELASLLYHDVFDYPLNQGELIKWVANPDKFDLTKAREKTVVMAKNGYFFLNGKEGVIYKRMLCQRAAKRKIIIAMRAATILSRLPSVLFVGVSGALAMGNAESNADIDLIIVTKKDTLWTSRLFGYLLLKLNGVSFRRYHEKAEADKICLNVWVEKGSLSWKKRNIYIAHEIAQVKPLVNKRGTFELFLEKNAWIKDYWPNAVRIKTYRQGRKEKEERLERLVGWLLKSLNPLFMKLQFEYMKGKKTKEFVSGRRALFHPVDWGSFVLKKLPV